MNKENVRSILANMVMSRTISQSLSVAAKLDIADLLGEGVLNIYEISKLTSTNISFLYRMMRLLANFDIFDELPSKNFKNNDISSLLRTDHPNSFKLMAIWLGEKPIWQSINQLQECLKTGKSGFELQNAYPLYDYLENNNSLNDLFHTIMRQKTRLIGNTIVKNYTFNKFKSIVDIGGGQGELMVKILSTHTDIAGAIFDLPLVTQQTMSLIKNLGLEDRCQCIPGDFFKIIPDNYDLYILMNVLHNWDNKNCIRLLKNCSKNIHRTDQRIIIIENIIDNSVKNNFNLIRDLEMMLITTGGKERTLEEFNELFKSSNLKLINAHANNSGYSILELCSSS